MSSTGEGVLYVAGPLDDAPHHDEASAPSPTRASSAPPRGAATAVCALIRCSLGDQPVNDERAVSDKLETVTDESAAETADLES